MNSTARSRALAALLMALALFAVLGCSGRSSVLAQVDGRTITVEDFETVAQTSASRYPMAPDAAKAALLDDLVRRELMLIAAQRLQLVPDATVAARRAQIEEDVLGQALLQSMAIRDVGVSDAEVQRFYDWRRTATHAQVIITPDEASAHAALDLVHGGMDFGLVSRRFDIGSLLPPGGDIGFVPPGVLVDPVDRLVRESKVGSIVGPARAGDSWFILKILGREARPEAAFASEAPQLRGMLEQRKQRMFVIRRYEHLTEAYRVALDPQGIEVLYAALNMNPAAPSALGAPEMPLTPAQRGMTIGTWDGGPGARGRYTVADAQADILANRGGQFNPHVQPSIEQWVRTRILQKIIVLEARRRHLDESPAVRERLREQLNNELLQAVYQREVVAVAVPADSEVRVLYAHVAPQLAQLRSVRVQYMTLPDSGDAVRAIQAANGRMLTDAVMLASPKLQVHEEAIAFPTRDTLWAMLQQPFQQQPLGTYLGPYHVSGGWRIVQLVSRDAPVPAFESLPPAMQQEIRQRAGEAARDRRLIAYTDSLRRSVPVTVNRDELRRAPWPKFSFMMPPG